MESSRNAPTPSRPCSSAAIRVPEGIPLPDPKPGPLRLLASIGRLHIVAIACLGTFTFGWLFTARHFWLISGICALDWFLVNLLNRVVDFEEDRINAIVGTDFVERHRRAITWLGCIALGISFPIVSLVAPRILPFRVAYHLLGLTYNWPLLPGRRRIKQLYFWKNTASATGFLITVFCYPLAASLRQGRLDLAPGISPATILIAGLFFFLFELSYEVIYDLRDVPGDARAGVRSYPVVHGEKVATRIVDGLMLFSAGMLLGGYTLRLIPWRLFIMICAPLIQLGVYKRAIRRGITSRDCILLTWMGSLLLLVYHLWVVLHLPGADLP
jgi:4-hydroxybenzoate polyprenyltransferase